jgi:DNA polymerase-1
LEVFVFTLDLETYKIGARLTPRIVSICYAIDDEKPVLLTRCFREFPDILKKASPPFVVQNGSFDFGCLAVEFPDLLPWIFEQYERGHVVDTMINAKLVAIENGTIDRQRFSLAAIAKRLLGLNVEGKEGDDAWRLRYHELEGVDGEDWPHAARQYAIKDVEITRAVHKAQNYTRPHTQARAAWALHLISVYGMRINEGRAGQWLEHVEIEAEKGRQKARDLGILRANGTRDVKILQGLITGAYDGKPPLTDKGKVSYSVDTLKGSGDASLTAYSESSFAAKLSSTYAPILKEGQTVHPRYNVLVSTGRTSCSKPNMQNPPRAGGFRELFEPRPGYVYALCDYDQIELVALGQIHLWMFKTSAIADAVNEGRDLHLEVAARLNPDNPPAYRQASKAANYGFAGGLGSGAFRQYARASGVDISEDEAKEIRLAWLKTWPEMTKYFKHISNKTTWGPCEITQFRSGRVRGGCAYTQAANTFFQGLVADGCKEALFNVSKACFIDQKSPLYGSRPVAFLHDEIILESPKGDARRAAGELQRIMIENMRRWIPDVKVSATAYLSTRWSKDAGPVYDGGELIPWAP